MTSKQTSKKPKVSFLMLGSREIAASEFKARCLEIMDEVQRTGNEVVITKHRKPVAKVVPMPKAGGFVGSMKGMAIVVGDIVSPLGDEDWTYDEPNLA